MQKLRVVFVISPLKQQILATFCQDSNGLIVVKLKSDLKYRGYVHFEPVRANVIYQALNYLKTHNKFYKDISISESLSSKEMINFSSIDQHQDVAESIDKKIISNET